MKLIHGRTLFSVNRLQYKDTVLVPDMTRLCAVCSGHLRAAIMNRNNNNNNNRKGVPGWIQYLRIEWCIFHLCYTNITRIKYLMVTSV